VRTALSLLLHHAVLGFISDATDEQRACACIRDTTKDNPIVKDNPVILAHEGMELRLLPVRGREVVNPVACWVTWCRNGIGRRTYGPVEFNSWTSCSHPCAFVTEQYNLLLAKEGRKPCDLRHAMHWPRDACIRARKMVSGWWIQKRRSAPPYESTWLDREGMKDFTLTLYPHDSMLWSCVGLSVRLSVTSRYCIKTVGRIELIFRTDASFDLSA